LNRVWYTVNETNQIVKSNGLNVCNKILIDSCILLMKLTKLYELLSIEDVKYELYYMFTNWEILGLKNNIKYI